MGTKSGTAGLTPRQQRWLGHLQACAKSGETVRAYAQRQGFSEHGMYQAAKELRKRGVLPPAPRRSKKRKSAAFVKVSPEVRPQALPRPWRVRLPNGVVLEGSGALGTELLEALARL
jgi:hypothetical protein